MMTASESSNRSFYSPTNRSPPAVSIAFASRPQPTNSASRARSSNGRIERDIFRSGVDPSLGSTPWLPLRSDVGPPPGSRIDRATWTHAGMPSADLQSNTLKNLVRELLILHSASQHDTAEQRGRLKDCFVSVAAGGGENFLESALEGCFEFRR